MDGVIKLQEVIKDTYLNLRSSKYNANAGRLLF